MFIVAGISGLVYHAGEFNAEHPFESEVLLAFAVRLLAILGGILLLRGSNAARWGLVVWLGYHVILSVFHAPLELLMHALLFAAVAYFLFRPKASAYLWGAATAS
jgi:hypothetical protein